MGRKAGISTSETLLRGEIAKALSAYVGKERGAQTRASRSLGITKQALSLYLRQKATPGSEVLRRICSTLNLILDVGGALIVPNRQEIAGGVLTPVQLSLFDAISVVDNHQLKVTVLRKHSSAIDLKVSIHFDG